MSLIQLPKVIELVNNLSLKVNDLEKEVKKLKEDITKQSQKVNNAKVSRES
jgi:predicted ATP-grasp superfamily ATP-dependent carboligase